MGAFAAPLCTVGYLTMHPEVRSSFVRLAMSSSIRNTLGYRAAKRAILEGRASFFGHKDADLPSGRSPQIASDDLLPQFGFVGARYEEKRVLLLGINPGNGPNTHRTSGDTTVMPALEKFVQDHTVSSYLRAQAAYRQVCESWPVWGRQCNELLRSTGLSLDEIAFSNALPWRTASKSRFSPAVAERTAILYVAPLLIDLQPSIVVAVGKRAAGILSLARTSEPLHVIVWNRAQALTKDVAADRVTAAAELRMLLDAY